MPIRTRTLVTGLMLAALLALPTGALAQAVDIPAVVTLDAPEETWANVSYTHQFKTDLDDSAGNFSRDGVQAAIGQRFAISDDWYFTVQGTYIGSYYNFSKRAGTSNARPRPPPSGGAYRFDDIHTLSVFGMFGWKASEKWTWVGGGIFKMSGEAGAQMDDALTGGGVVGFSYKSSDTLRMGLLVGVISQIEDSAGLLPIPTLNWQFADHWKLDFGLLGTLGHPGVGPDLSYRPSDHWEFGIGAAYQTRRFRLDDHQNYANLPPNGGSSNPNRDGVGQDTSLPLYARVRWAPKRTAFVDLYAGVTVAGKLRIESEHGGLVNETNYDPAPILGLRGMILF